MSNGTLGWLENREEHLKWFGKVENLGHWKKPIKARYTGTDEDIEKIDDAVCYFHGQGLSRVEFLRDNEDGTKTYRIHNNGYCCD